MTRIFTDGGELGDNLFWDSGGYVSSSNPVPVQGNYSYDCSSATKYFTAVSEFYFRSRCYLNNGVAGTRARTYFRSGANNTLVFTYEATTGNYAITGAVTDSSMTPSVINPNTWVLVEYHIKIDASAGVIEMKVDGLLVYSYTGNTKGAYPATIDNIYFEHGATGLGGGQNNHDDLALNDTGGTEDNSWCGDGYVAFLKPNGNGTYSDYIGSDTDQTDNYLMVDEIPSDGDSTYVDGANSGDKDTYTHETMSLIDKNVLRVWVEARTKNTVADGTGVKTVIKRDGSLYKSSNIPIGTSYQRLVSPDYTTDPSTSLEWSEAGLNEIEIGTEVE